MRTGRVSWSDLPKKAYLPALHWALRRKAVLIAGSAVLLVGAMLLVPRLGTEFMPIMDEGAFDADIQFLPGISLSRSLELSREVEARLMKFPELKKIVGKTGQTGIALEARGVEKTGFVGMLKPRGEWTTTRSREELLDRMREAVQDLPGMAISFSPLPAASTNSSPAPRRSSSSSFSARTWARSRRARRISLPCWNIARARTSTSKSSPASPISPSGPTAPASPASG